MKRRMSRILALTLAVLCTACSGRQTETEYRDSTVISAETENADTVKEETTGSEEDVVPMNKQTGSGQIPEELEQIPEEYFGAASEQGTVERLEYQTWESMSYEAQTTQLTKTAYVYLPYGYSGEQQYNVLYLMHGGWSNEETYLGTPENVEGQEVILTRMEFDVLYFLASNPNIAFTKEQIYGAVSKDDYSGGAYVIRDIIYRLRTKLKITNIQTLHGYGYKFSTENGKDNSMM